MWKSAGFKFAEAFETASRRELSAAVRVEMKIIRPSFDRGPERN
jgi:uncharacterized protein YqeY